MVTSNPRDFDQFVQVIEDALPRAVRETFGGGARLSRVTPGTLPLLVLDLGGGHHLHLEIEVRLAGYGSHTLVLVLRAEDAGRLFDLEIRPDASLSEPDTQLIVLAEFTEGAEALTAALGPILVEHGVSALLRVSGASLEDADNSPVAASAPFGNREALAFSGELAHGAAPMMLVVAAAPELAAAMTPGSEEPVSGGNEPVIPMPRPSFASSAAPVAASTGPRVMAHPLQFGQLEPAAGHGRVERSVDLILDVVLKVRVELGSTSMTVEEVLGLSPGSVVELDRLAGEPVDIVINDRLIARGEVVVVEENFGVRVTEIVAPRQRAGVAV